MKNNELFLKSGINVMQEPAVWEGTTATPHNGTSSVTPFRPAATAEGLGSNSTWRNGKALRHTNESTPLARLVRQRLSEMGIKQSEFCRAHRFDQGLLSKIQNSVITNLSLESVLRLSVGLSVPPEDILALLDRMDLHDLVLQAYSAEFAAQKA